MSQSSIPAKPKRGGNPAAPPTKTAPSKTAPSKPGAGASRGSSTAAAEDLHDGWERFWFTPEPAGSLRVVRLGLGVIAAAYFASHWADIAYWFASDGLLSTERLGRVLGMAEAAGENRWHLTPLYWIESAVGLRLVLALGIVASLLTAAGIGGRWVVAVAWLTFLSVASRCWVIAGLAEIPLAFGLGPLVIAGGVGWGGPRPPRQWTTGLARRLLEIHVSALVAATALAQLASEIWWNGLGVLQLVLPPDGPAFELSSIGNSPLLAAALTHAIVWLPMAGVPLLWIAPTRRLAATVLILHALAVALLSGQMLYGAANAVLLSLFLIPRGPRGPQHGEQG